MATFVNDLRLTELATGEGSGSWGTTTNTNLELIGEAFSFGTEAITTNADTHTTTIADGSTDPGRSMFLQYTGTLDSACTITIAPNTVSKLWFIENATSGSQSIIISQGSGANITIPNGQTKAIYSDGAGSGAAMVDAFQDLSIPDLFVDDDLTVGDDLILSSDGAIVKFGADADTTLTHTDGTGLTLNSTNKLTFGDAASFVQQSSDGVLRIDGEATIDLNASTAVTVSNDLKLDSDSAVLGFGADNDTTLTHTDGSGLTLNSTNKIMFNDASQFIQGSSATVLSLGATDEIDLTATAIDVNGTVDMSSTLNVSGAITSSAGATITVSDNSDVLTLVSTDADDAFGPFLNLHRNSSSPADNDGTGVITFAGENDNNEEIDYAQIQTAATDVSDGTEDGTFIIQTMVAGTSRDRITVSPSETAVNENSVDVDFRVESNNNANMFLVDAGNDRIQIANLLLGEISSNVDIIQSTSSDGLLIDVTGDITLDADGADVILKDGGTSFLEIDKDGNNVRYKNPIADGDILFQGVDGSSTITALTLDMSAAGKATFTTALSDNTNLQINNTSNDQGSHFTMYNASSSPANDDVLGSIDFNGNDSGGTETIFGRIRASANNVANGSESGNMAFAIQDSGSLLEHMRINTAGVVVNEISQAGTDFRVESNDQTHALFVDSGANTVGVGSSSPTNVLDVAFTASAHTSGISSTNLQSGGFGSVIAFNSTRSDGAGIKTAARIGTQGHENWSSDDTCSSNLIFETRKDNTLAERMRLVTDGKLGVGISTPDCRVHIMDGNASASSNAGAVLTVENDGNCFIQMLTPNSSSAQLRFGDPQDDGAGSLSYNHSTNTMAFSVNGPTRMSIDSSGSVSMPDLSSGAGNADLRFNTGNGDVTFDTSSRLVKEDIEDIPYGLDAVKKLAPKKYKRTDGEKEVELGLIADEVVEVIPEIVGIMPKSVFTKEESDTEEIAGSVRYSKLTAVLVKAIQEQQAQIEALQTKVAALEGGS